MLPKTMEKVWGCKMTKQFHTPTIKLDITRQEIGPDRNGSIGRNVFVSGMHIGGYMGPIDLENDVEKKAAFIVKAVNCHDELVEALEEMTAEAPDGWNIEDVYRVIEKARAILAKAKAGA